MFFCTQCGANNPTNARFCGQCGHQLVATPAEPTPQPEVPTQPEAPPPPQKPVVYVPNYMVWSILATVLCCLPTGIVAIVYSAQVDTKLRLKDYEGAKKSSSNAAMWAWISLAVGLLVLLIYILAAVAAISRDSW